MGAAPTLRRDLGVREPPPVLGRAALRRDPSAWEPPPALRCAALLHLPRRRRAGAALFPISIHEGTFSIHKGKGLAREGMFATPPFPHPYQPRAPG